MLEIIECPRDAMQGLHDFIPTEKKIDYINTLLSVGFHTIDFGSFVSPKVIPQMADTSKVLKGLDIENSTSKLLAIVANKRGADDASAFDEIDFLGYPFSISETFQKRNTNASLDESLTRVETIKKICEANNKELVIYISMAFGNPYGDPWSPDIAMEWSRRLNDELEIDILSLSDTIGSSDPKSIKRLFSTLIPELPKVEFGAHLHTTPGQWREKVDAAYSTGCRRFDGAIKGFGGCPMAADELTGNMPTENLISYCSEKNIETPIDEKQFAKAVEKATATFPPQ